MKTTKLQLLSLATLILLGLSGCEKAKVTNQASADVFIKAIKNTEGIPVYTVVHSVFSFNTITSVSVTSPDGTKKELTNPGNSGNSFYNIPVDADYLQTLPSSAIGSYTYLVKFNDGEEITYTNSLSNLTIQPANITSLTKSANGDSVYVSWDAIPNVNFYQVEITKGTAQIYYSDKFYDGSSPLKANLRLGFNLYNLTTAGGSGAFRFNINGLLYETATYDYLQATSTATNDIEL
ncbi:MAG TPA: hypothetical protein VFC67_25925 [Prolixibacteraceae bacterium]|nr:hypothetical protein [Prolixibacteraceae bacterium]